MDVVKTNDTCLYYIVDQGGHEKRFYLHRGFIGWSGIGWAPEAMYFILRHLYIQRQRPSPTAVSSLTWDVNHAIFSQLLDHVYQARS